MNHRADLNYLLDNDGRRDRDRPLVRARRRHARACRRRSAACSAPTSRSTSGRYKIARIYDNESWNPELRAPLAAPGVDVTVGDYIVAINGVELRAPDNIYRLLDGTANRQTVLTVNSKPVDGRRAPGDGRSGRERADAAHARVGRSTTAGSSTSCRTASSRTSTCRTPGSPATRASTATTSRSRTRRAPSIDERYNGGGSAADYIIDVLQRDFDGYFNNVAGDRMPFTSPAAGIWGPKVMIINEMAGSGGDLMPYMFKRRKIGTLVGKRTWGGLVHTADTPTFIDGGSMIAPRGGFFIARRQVGGGERRRRAGHRRRELAEGRDRRPATRSSSARSQEAMRLLKEKPVERLTKEPPPPTTGKRKKPGL